MIDQLFRHPISAKNAGRIAIAAPGAILALFAGVLPAAAQDAAKPKSERLVIQEQGSFLAGGTVVTTPGKFDSYNPKPDGQTLHGDHAYVFYQIPENPRQFPMVMWHGGGQFSKTWETTPDGREGYQNIFLRRSFSTYVIDAPRRGRAGTSTKPGTIPATPTDQFNFGNFRLGNWPDFFANVQFSRDPKVLEEFFRQQTPDTGPFDLGVVSDGVAAVFAKIGPGILVTHSQAGGPGWLTAIKSRNVKAVVSYEPGSNFTFPEGSVPAPINSPFMGGTSLPALGVPMAQFMELTKIPIIIYYGDNIPEKPTNAHADVWRIRIEMARLFRDAVNSRGGDVTLVHLPEIGIRGNSHFAFSDKNNVEIADHLSKYLKDKKLDLPAGK